MKKTNLLAYLATATIICYTSCNQDNETSGEQEEPKSPVTLAALQNANEDHQTPTSILENGIKIEGAKKVTGHPPAPNGTLDFYINTDKKEAFQHLGFNVSFASNKELSGAYLTFKDANGKPTNSYFNVPASSFDSYGITPIITNDEIQNSSRESKRNGSEIAIYFDSNITAGEFCFDISVYDDSNNVSKVQEICILVEAWGGHSALVGEWVRVQHVPENIQSELHCNNGDVIAVQYAVQAQDDYLFVLKEDGSFYEISHVESKELNFKETKANCNAVYGDMVTVKEKFIGKWAYNEVKGTLTVIDFKYEDLLDPTKNENYSEGGGLLFEDAKVKLDANELSFTGGGPLGVFNRN